jgi:hypothetical protein
VLQDNGADDKTINGNGMFAFGMPIASGANYLVTVKTQPTNPSQTCVVTNGSNNVGSADVSDVTVACTTNKYTIAGSITGVT